MNEEQRLLQGYRYLAELSRDLASTLDLDILLDRIIRASKEILGAEAASILLYDEVEKHLYFQAATNLDPPLMRGLLVPLENSIAGWIVSHRQPVRTSDVGSDPRHFANIEELTHFKTTSLLGVPMVTKDKVIGVLEVLNKLQGEFDPSDEHLLTVLAAQAAVAIENTRLFHQSDLISEFIHELRTPLSSISTATYLMLKSELKDEQRQQLVQTIHAESTRLNEMATSFLDLARLESGRVQYHLSRFNLVTLLEECTQLMQVKADENKVRIITEVPQDLPEFEADREKIKQVLINLVSNAIKYNTDKGWVRIRMSLAGDEVIIQVQDGGIGIPQESLPFLFKKFYRVKSSEAKAIGTGLGLSICRKIIQGHGGKIDVESVNGVGTSFFVHLPLRTNQPAD